MDEQRAKGKLHWYEYLWASLPIGLVAAGGAIGGACGGIAAALNVKLMGTERPPWQKYCLTAVISSVAIVTYFAGAKLFLSLTGLGHAMTVSQLDGELAKTPLFVTIRKVEPDEYARIRDLALDAAEHGRGSLDIQALVRVQVSALIAKYRPLASGPALLDAARLFTLQLDQIGAKDAKTCVAMLYPIPGASPPDIARYVTPEVMERSGMASAAIIETGAAKPQAMPKRSDVEAALNQVVQQLVNRFGIDAVAALNKPETLSPDRLCALNSAIYKEALSLPTEQAVPLLRFLFSATGSA